MGDHRSHAPLLTSSTARDIAAGVPSELDAITGAVVRAGERLGVGTPVLARMFEGMPSVVALIPARSGSERVKDKNIRPLAGHPLLAYAIATARRSGTFDRVVVSTDSETIADVARWYGADVPSLRPAEYATSTSPDIEWIKFTLERLPEQYDLFAYRPGDQPLPWSLRRAARPGAAVGHARGRFHPRCRARRSSTRGRCGSSPTTVARWSRCSTSLTSTSRGMQASTRPCRACTTRTARSRSRGRESSRGTGTREGRVLAPFLTEGVEGFNVDDEADWERAEVSRPRALPRSPRSIVRLYPYPDRP